MAILRAWGSPPRAAKTRYNVPSVRVLFLDFDGVLNAIDPNAAPSDDALWTAAWIEPRLVERLNAIVRATDARVVVSSSWRAHRTCAELAAMLADRGFEGAVVDVTPLLAVPGREREIQAWLRDHSAVDAYAILDDDHDFDGLAERVVRVVASAGLSDGDVARAVATLRAP
ncbi:MAG: HAD domain-containing protein [Polyangiales bacterium]